MEKAFYYMRDAKNRPRVTVCLLMDVENGLVSKGLSICSGNDNPCRSKGRAIAEGRAVQAMMNGSTGGKVIRKEALETIYEVGVIDDWLRGLLQQKSQYNVVHLNEMERKLVGKMATIM